MNTILVAHGALGSASQMQPIVDALRALDGGLIRIETLEFPGHGATPLLDDDAFRLERLVDHMASRVLHMAGPPPLLFGYSMGGYVGLALAARAPRAFRGIVTLGTKFEWDRESAEREAARLDPVAIATKVPKFASMLAARHSDAGGWESVVCRTAALLRANGENPLLTIDVLERVSIPVCVAVGTKDDTVSIAESQAAANVMPRGYCVTLDDTPHPIERVSVARIVEMLKTLRATIVD
jgi:pimeloyl-ACP methyl ester carboxylesterase